MLPSIGRIRQEIPIADALCRLSDGMSIAIGLLAALQWRPELDERSTVLVSVSAIVIYYMVAELTGIYRSWRGASAEREIICALLTWSGCIIIMLSLGVAVRFYDQLSRGVLAFWFVTTPTLLLGFRTLARVAQRALRARGLNIRRFAIIGVNELGVQLARNAEASPETGMKLIGFFDDRSPDRTIEVPMELGVRAGNMADLLEMARRSEVDTIYITFPMRAENRIKAMLADLSDTTASVYIVPDFFVFKMLHSRWTDVGGIPAVSVFENPFYGIDGVVKRVLDLVSGCLALIVFAIPMLLIALLIKLTSPGPVFFKQRRYGLDGKEILVWKFRSMRVMENGEKVTQATKDDPRVTPLGKILRRTSLDEVPQIFNVLDGTMSMVGPRPHATAHNEQYRSLIDGYMLRHKVKPGITGLAQVNGCRGETDTLEKMERRVQFDHQYIREWSLWLDIKIMFRTIGVVFKRNNAY